MVEKNEANNIRKEHPTSFKGIYKSYSLKDVFESKPFWGSLILTFVFGGLFFFSDKSFYELLLVLNENVLNLYPNLLGFNLGGYALIIGFGNNDLIKGLTKKGKDKKNSIFQRLNGIFAFTLILQAFVLIFAFVSDFVISLDLGTSSTPIYYFTNGIALFVITFFGLWGILILPIVIANVFTFGQLHHFTLTKERIKDRSTLESTEKTKDESGS